MKRWYSLAPAALALFLISCEKDELAVPAFDRGDAITVQVVMGVDYTEQVWFDLGTESAVATNSRFDWDLALGGDAEAPWLYLNSSTAMQAAPTGTSDFEAITGASDFAFRIDHPTGTYDSLSLGKWWESDQVYIVDMGYNVSGTLRGMKKVQFDAPTAEGVTFRYANLDGSDERQGAITRKPDHYRVAYSLFEHTEVSVEPAKGSYDLLFTTYMHQFYDPYLPYLVNGVVLNPHQTRAIQISDIPFNEITVDVLADYSFSTEADIVGYDWKFYSLDEGAFTVFPEISYVIEDSEGFLYKLHFVDFYNEAGEKGHPLIEMQRL